MFFLAVFSSIVALCHCPYQWINMFSTGDTKQQAMNTSKFQQPSRHSWRHSGCLPMTGSCASRSSCTDGTTDGKAVSRTSDEGAFRLHHTMLLSEWLNLHPNLRFPLNPESYDSSAWASGLCGVNAGESCAPIRWWSCWWSGCSFYMLTPDFFVISASKKNRTTGSLWTIGLFQWGKSINIWNDSNRWILRLYPEIFISMLFCFYKPIMVWMIKTHKTMNTVWLV